MPKYLPPVSGIGNRVIRPQVDLFVFDAAPQRLDEQVGEPATLVIHAVISGRHLLTQQHSFLLITPITIRTPLCIDRSSGNGHGFGRPCAAPAVALASCDEVRALLEAAVAFGVIDALADRVCAMG